MVKTATVITATGENGKSQNGDKPMSVTVCGVCLKSEIHEIHEIHCLISEIHSPKGEIYEIHSPTTKSTFTQPKLNSEIHGIRRL